MHTRFTTLMLSCALLGAADVPAGRQAVPTGAELAAAQALIDEVFQDDLARPGAEARRTLARRMLEQARDGSNGPAAIHALLVAGGRFAAQADAADLVCDALRRLEAAHGPAGIPRELIDDAAAWTRRPDRAKMLAEECLRLASGAADQEAWEVAVRAASVAGSLARKALNGALVDRVGTVQIRIQHLLRESRKAAAARLTLVRDPGDPAANGVVGRHLCLVAGRWQEGLPLLARCGDADLRLAAEQDLAQMDMSQPGSLVRLGDTWFDRAERERTRDLCAGMRVRARHWYGKALPALGGLARMRIEQRLLAIDALEREVAANAGSRPAWAADFGADASGVWAALDLDGQRQVMRLVPAGRFRMGSGLDDAEERQVHEVTITRPFWLGDSEMTQGMWQAVMGVNPSCFVGDAARPVETVSWNDCRAFLQRVNGKVLSLQARLPTEAEWEYACRAGDDHIRAPDALAWFGVESRGSTFPVRTKAPNAWGLHDMQGNVWEWCADWYGAYPTGMVRDPAGPPAGSERVLRGGAWNSSASRCRADVRFQAAPDSRGGTLGFRIAAPYTPTTAWGGERTLISDAPKMEDSRPSPPLPSSSHRG